MASPQKENGYTGIANEILDETCRFNFNGAQFRIIMKVWRMTYGYGRKAHEFSLTFLHASTGISERTVKKEVAALVKANVLIVTRKATSTTARMLAFNKDFDAWTIPKGGEPVIQGDLFDDLGGSDSSPHSNEGEGSNTSPQGGSNTSPQSNDFPYSGGSNTSPIKRKKILNKVFKENVDYFAIFYSAYPRRISKAAAQKAWSALEKSPDYDPELIIQNTRNYAETCKLLGTETRYIPHPSTYLNQKRFEDYNSVDPEGITAGSGGNKVSDNMDFLKNQLGGGQFDQGRSGAADGESFRSLPGQRSEFEEEP
ncbi:phage replication protein O [Paenibacillus sp. UNCCL117]|uniref:replication protein n=1 Tax=unclassified Paenibacillus TaxID=185978 RepID=UPI00087F8E75|nr:MULTISPECIES: replication protein [unclassified Paenibacillus]SDD28326.1 phage replication protein O, N-terminal domain-containing protein [Paenibacillus sp. cl123]SFW40928.1 phage replication protein O [Paenibacillus sp. UNCCL117]